jgi:hypothetical protein
MFRFEAFGLTCQGFLIVSLLQNTFIVSAGELSLVSALQTDTIYTIQKEGLFSIGCCPPVLKIIIGIGWLKAADTNKCPAGRYGIIGIGCLKIADTTKSCTD